MKTNATRAAIELVNTPPRVRYVSKALDAIATNVESSNDTDDGDDGDDDDDDDGDGDEDDDDDDEEEDDDNDGDDDDDDDDEAVEDGDDTPTCQPICKPITCR